MMRSWLSTLVRCQSRRLEFERPEKMVTVGRRGFENQDTKGKDFLYLEAVGVVFTPVHFVGGVMARGKNTWVSPRIDLRQHLPRFRHRQTSYSRV